MTQKRILVLNGHPAAKSLSAHFAQNYAEAAGAAGAIVRVHHLSEMNFDVDFGQGNYSEFKPLEPVLEQCLSDLEWAEHLVVTTPMWWGGLAGKAQGIIRPGAYPGAHIRYADQDTAWLASPDADWQDGACHHDIGHTAVVRAGGLQARDHAPDDETDSGFRRHQTDPIFLFFRRERGNRTQGARLDWHSQGAWAAGGLNTAFSTGPKTTKCCAICVTSRCEKHIF